ncbi:AraC family transcriptional regulator ligand-binding domain-containing protein [Streptomyces sp. B21-102]|uniref:AraC family transcriptional regulator ligand-binding domain-containing protein n=1 Tax=Streptomyces sp. B21-102 TaxID=3039416 RepID=UPI002FEF023E
MSRRRSRASSPWAASPPTPASHPRRSTSPSPAPRDVRPFRDLFRCPLHFGASRNRLVVPQAWINRPMPGRDPVTYASTLELLVGQMASHDAARQQDRLVLAGLPGATDLPVIAA